MRNAVKNAVELTEILRLIQTEPPYESEQWVFYTNRRGFKEKSKGMNMNISFNLYVSDSRLNAYLSKEMLVVCVFSSKVGYLWRKVNNTDNLHCKIAIDYNIFSQEDCFTAILHPNIAYRSFNTKLHLDTNTIAECTSK